MSIIDRINNFKLPKKPKQPEITILLDGRGSRLYNVGDTLAGSYWFDSVGGDEIQAVEVSIVWLTEGKGNEDLGVHAFWRCSIDDGDWIDPRRPGRFSTILPRSPLSYCGILVKISWKVRVRLFLADGRETVEEIIFHLGSLPDVRTLKPIEL
ncbi:MAG: hypothetical protein LBC74_10970 [Planctomycetaceae bacterium]|jgi:hypothetical protein|nr:hypothetical protein [Planctomycetaceae bacterium]